MRRKIIAGNWKMNADQAFVRDFAETFSLAVAGISQKVEVILAPPALYAMQLREALASTRIDLAAQNVSEYPAGAYTGEVSAAMVADLGLGYSLVGHSERRSLFNESDAVVIAKVGQMLQSSVVPILCVGETLEERERGAAESVVTRQVKAVLDAFDVAMLSDLVIAYEPVWAIGTGKTATPDVAQGMHAVVRSVIGGKSKELAEKCPILYGGSVNAANAEELFEQPDIDGGLVGGASLKSDEFKKICECMD